MEVELVRRLFQPSVSGLTIPFHSFPCAVQEEKKNTALRVDLCQGSEVLAISLEV